MQFLGTFKVLGKELNTVYTKGNVGTVIERAIRDELKMAFLTVGAHYLVDVALRIPVLTGRTRRAVKQAVMEIDLELNSLGLAADYASRIPMEETAAKKDEGYVEPGDTPLAYLGSYQWSANTIVVSRREDVLGDFELEDSRQKSFEIAAMDEGLDPMYMLKYTPTGNQASAKFSLFFSLISEYWEKYNAGVTSIHQNEPWRVMEASLSELERIADYLFGGISNLAILYADSIFQSDVTTLPEVKKTIRGHFATHFGRIRSFG